MKKVFAFSGAVFICVSATSCDPPAGVALKNLTASEKHITVIYPENFKFPCGSDTMFMRGMLCDSIKTYDLAADANNSASALTIPRESWDKVNRTYSFRLQPNHIAYVESRALASVTYGQVFIVDRKDTVAFTVRGKLFVKKPKFLLGGLWTYTIQ
jgi:hypothetical protein